MTHQPTHDPATNPVTAPATFDGGRFLADNVGNVVTRADMLSTFPTKVSTCHLQTSYTLVESEFGSTLL